MRTSRWTEGALFHARCRSPLTVAELRRACRIRTSTLCGILSDLVTEGRVRRTAAGYLPAGR